MDWHPIQGGGAGGVCGAPSRFVLWKPGSGPAGWVTWLEYRLSLSVE